MLCLISLSFTTYHLAIPMFIMVMYNPWLMNMFIMLDEAFLKISTKHRHIEQAILHEYYDFH